MRRLILILIAILIVFSQLISEYSDSEYFVISWNDLGMHCSNGDFSTLVILPPYNNIVAQVIRRGNPDRMPEIVTEGFKITYEFPDNTYSVGKTNFWNYAEKLYGVKLQNNIGLTGLSLTGEFSAKGNYFIAQGIPLTPFKDGNLSKEDPYQQALVKLFDSQNNYIHSSKPVVPVSNEIGCVGSGCHSSAQSIISEHGEGLNSASKPIFCASCHESVASGIKPVKNSGNLSYRIHNRHSFIGNNCYKCHPGPNTQCFRDVMFTKGLNCTSCHGNVSNVGSTARSSRKPWLQEPTCGDSKCHGETFATETNKLFKESKGHGGLFCSACHGSPHAIYPTVNDRDNEQIVALQGFAGKLKDCKVCHGFSLNIPGPHGIVPSQIDKTDLNSDNTCLLSLSPNPVRNQTLLKFRLSASGYVRIDIFNSNGKKECSVINESLSPGEYSSSLNPEFLVNGLYNCVLMINNKAVSTMKMYVSR